MHPPTPALYQQIVLEHSRAPRRFGELAQHTHAADGSNPLCGDALHVELRVAGGRIVDYAFRGEACALARASASMLGDRLDGVDVGALDAIDAALRRLVAGSARADDGLGDLNALAALAQYPSRRKCALLPLATVRAALAGARDATTEKTRNEESPE
jgi:nitrogen fixation NifU-like protein